MARQPWNGETGHIDQALLQKYLSGTSLVGSKPAGTIYHLAGPPAITEATEEFDQ